MIPALGTLAGLLPGWAKWAGLALAAAGLVAAALWWRSQVYAEGYAAAEAECQAAELARQLAQERELTRIAQEAAQAAEGRRLYAERQAEALRAASQRIAAADWRCGAEPLPPAVYDEVR